MNSRLVISAATTWVLVAMAGAVFGQGTDAPPKRFGQLLRVGESVLLRPFTGQPVYTIHLLSREQAQEVETTHANYEELAKQKNGIEERLLSERDVNQRGALYVIQQALEADMAKVSSVSRLETYAYVIAHVGEDFVTLKKPGKQKFIPLRTIREMYRSELLSSRSFRSGRRSASSATEQRVFRIGLERTRAREVAAVVDKFYPDPTREISVNVDANLLQITASSSSATGLKRFIDTLDAAVLDENDNQDEPKP